ncbi:SafA/ExsA family spore coat assembly protein [Cytobacillus praedii]|uniref:SafA/ExsA family spore coat assembly protein n=1 Tax=Cytobacillus praedii TaxID=1742358 RepID=UPI002E1FDB85|nr:SafA/ExsA family spore coat assembly protein [Cytobacillus praedii]MED3571473.1 SafA/ExsA family spore coat assembly protein [Cytobacillus praedii]
MKIHIVQKGDTLWKIAKKYGVNFEELKKMNTQLSNPDMIMPGMKIKVPGAGGSVKKEAPIGGMPDAKINMGAKKEMPKAEHPFAKEKPKTMPVVEAPKEVPVAPAPPKKEAPKVTAPQVEIPKEVPKKPFIPKMPKPIMPEIDINNYYMMNMANLSVQQPAPQLPPKPVNILPEVKPIETKPIESKPIKPVKPIKPIAEKTPKPKAIESELFAETQQGGFEQPMYPYYPSHLFPVSPVMPGPGFQGGYPQQMGYPQVQGAAMPMHQMPHQNYGLAGVESPGFHEESSPFMPMHQMPHMNPEYMMPSQAQNPAPVMGAQDMGQQQLPLQPTYTAPAMQPNYGYPCPPNPCPPYPTHLIPVSPVMPGSGFCGPVPYGQMPFGFPQMAPQVQGVMEEMPNMAQMPLMPTQSQMPIMPSQSQMPIMPSQSQMPLMPTEHVKESDCGCGGGAPQMSPYGFGHGFVPGVQPYGAPYGQQMGFAQPFPMNPYGPGQMGGQAFGMPRNFDESSEFDV